MHLFRYAGGASSNGHPTALGIVSGLGLATNLKLCLDAGDANSYAGGASWLDTAGSGYDFFRGTTSGADATDPTFAGTSGKRTSSEYFSSDGGDLFTYDTTNETWMNNIHKDNALWTFAFWYYSAVTGVARGLAGTDGGSSATIGFDLFITAGANSPRILIADGSGSNALDYNPGGAITASAWNFLGFSVDETDATTGARIVRNGSATTTAGTYATPSASNATYTLQLGGRGNSVQPYGNGDRMGMVWAWEGTALTTTNLSDIYTASRTRYGV